MIFKVLTVYNRKNGYSDGIFISRSEHEFTTEFIIHILDMNKNLREQKKPQIKLDDYQIKIIGNYDDEKCKLLPFVENIDVPMILDFDPDDNSEDSISSVN